MKFKSLPHLESPSKKRRREGNLESRNVDRRLLSTQIKDLRSKRVFSTKLIGRSPTKPAKRIEEYNEGKEEKKDESGENGDVNYAVPSVFSEKRTGLSGGAREEFDNVVGVVNSVDSNSNFSSNFSESNGHGGISLIDQENNGSSGVSKRAGVFDEEWQQKTPPDPEKVSLQELKGNGDRKLATVESSDGEKRNGFDSNSKPRLMLKPCFKRKLFRAPGSFSYKRLLPYLVDIAGGTMEDDQSTKLNGSEKSPTSNLDDFCKECSHGDSGICPQSLPSSTPQPSHGINPKSESSRESTRLPIPIDKNSSFKEPCSKPSIGSPSGDQKSSDEYHDRVVEGSDVSKDDLIWESPRDNKQVENRVLVEIDCPFPWEVQTMPSVNSKFLETNGDLSVSEPEIDMSVAKIGNGKLRIADNQSDGALEFLNSIDSSNKVQPISSEENVGKRFRCNLLDSDLGLSKTSNGCENPRLNATNHRNKLNIRNKFVRDPLAQLKLFGNPSSFSYKRLLPFITDLVEDNTKNQVPSADDEVPKLEEGKTMELHPRVEDSSGEKNCMNESNICEFNVKQPTCDLDTEMALSPTKCSTSRKGGNTTPSDAISELTGISQELQSEQVISDQLELESCILGAQLDMEIDPNVSSSIPTSTSRPESFHQERTKLFPVKPSVIDPMGLELKRTHLEVPSPSKTPSLSSRKGILKKNPRGCRGLCSCLSCSSFRLHAERAFEFSSNLMLDADEVASDLMKELSYARTMLERAVDWINDEPGDRVNQVKEACRKASEAETLAKGRLCQMNYELNIHSRIPCPERPNVKFAANVEEKVIEDTGRQTEFGVENEAGLA